MAKSPEPSSPAVLRVLIEDARVGELRSARLPAPTPILGSPQGPRVTSPPRVFRRQEHLEPTDPAEDDSTDTWGPHLPSLHQGKFKDPNTKGFKLHPAQAARKHSRGLGPHPTASSPPFLLPV